MFRFASTVFLMVSAACTSLPGEDRGEATVVDELFTNCQSTGICPENSPVIATFPFHELDVSGTLPNAEGFTIQKFLINGSGHDLAVKQGHITGYRGNRVVSGAGLQGAELWVRREALEYVLRITSVRNVDMWARADPTQPAPQIEGYQIDWTRVVNGQPTSEWRNVCAGAMLPTDSPDLLGVPNYLTFVFEGERIDPRAKVITGFDPRWFNLGCAGHTMMKMYLMGHVDAARPLGYTTTIDERQAIMKMFAADYCGTGYAFTVPGVDLQWQDDRRWVRYPGSPPPSLAELRVEARWKASGAVCLEVPRAMENPTADSRALWPSGVIPEITARCPALLKAPCGTDIHAFEGYHLVTANP